MPVTSVENRDIEVTLNGEEVGHLFDADGSETFDGLLAVEAALVDGPLTQIETGDVLVVTIHV